MFWIFSIVHLEGRLEVFLQALSGDLMCRWAAHSLLPYCGDREVQLQSFAILRDALQLILLSPLK